MARKPKNLAAILPKGRGRPMMPAVTKLGNTIRSIRKAKHLTLEEVAEITGLPLSTVRAVEVGGIRVPSPRVLRPIATALEPETNYSALALLVYDDSPVDEPQGDGVTVEMPPAPADNEAKWQRQQQRPTSIAI